MTLANTEAVSAVKFSPSHYDTPPRPQALGKPLRGLVGVYPTGFSLQVVAISPRKGHTVRCRYGAPRSQPDSGGHGDRRVAGVAATSAARPAPGVASRAQTRLQGGDDPRPEARLARREAPRALLQASLAAYPRPEHCADDPVLLTQVRGRVALARARTPRSPDVADGNSAGGVLEPVPQ